MLHVLRRLSLQLLAAWCEVCLLYTSASSYTWSKFTGKDGKDGTAGADSYVHFAYAQSADGSVNFSVVEYEGATHIGVYTDNVKEDSTDYKKYAWSQIRGEDGTRDVYKRQPTGKERKTQK